jgi:hypothetical protein
MAALELDLPIRPGQLRRLQAVWHQWTARLRLSPDADRALRHYYVEVFSGGRAREAKQLTRADAELVIAWLERLARTARANRAAGTAGRHGYPERPRMRPTRAAWRALWGHAAALGMTRQQLDLFIARHYGGVGLSDVRDIRSMADLNRVLWGLKGVLRRRQGSSSPPDHPEQKAA